MISSSFLWKVQHNIMNMRSSPRTVVIASFNFNIVWRRWKFYLVSLSAGSRGTYSSSWWSPPGPPTWKRMRQSSEWENHFSSKTFSFPIFVHIFMWVKYVKQERSGIRNKDTKYSQSWSSLALNDWPQCWDDSCSPKLIIFDELVFTFLRRLVW